MKIRKLICRIFGHTKQMGQLQRSPYTCHTHIRSITCSRCGEILGCYHEYHDIQKEPELFQWEVGQGW
ncbi:hypothetical protein RvVAR031_36550 [Agrobacterium vitis]|nr:hypothetical protein RvVAR031_36550 [Agrobacterium vitis]